MDAIHDLLSRVSGVREDISAFNLTGRCYAAAELLPLIETKAREIPVTFTSWTRIMTLGGSIPTQTDRSGQHSVLGLLLHLSSKVTYPAARNERVLAPLAETTTGRFVGNISDLMQERVQLRRVIHRYSTVF